MKGLLATLVIVVLLAPLSAGAIEITATSDPAALLTALGATGTNATVLGAPSQTGTYTNMTGLWGIGPGIVLSSGDVTLYEDGPSLTGSKTTNFADGYDADLAALVPGYAIHDATSFSFDFTPTQDQLTFEFVFGSEEYPEWVGTPYNDPFGAFLTDLTSGGTSQICYDNMGNIISVNNVFFGVTPTGTELDGATLLLETVWGVTPGNDYNIKFAIADAGDQIYDSAVYISNFSETTGQEPGTEPAVPEPATVLLLGSGLVGLAGLRRKMRG